MNKFYLIILFFFCICLRAVSQDNLRIDLDATHEAQQKKLEQTLSTVAQQIKIIKNIEKCDETTLNKVKDAIRTIEVLQTALKAEMTSYKNNIENSVQTQMTTIKQAIKDLKAKLNKQQGLYEELKKEKEGELAKKVLSYLDKEFKEGAELQAKLTRANLSIGQKNTEIEILKNAKNDLTAKNIELEKKITAQNTELSFLKKKGFRVGIALGFGVNSKEYQYLVGNDNTATESVLSGPVGIVSAVAIMQPKKLFGKDDNKWQLIANVPLAEVGLGGGASTASSIFNRKISLGLGIGYEFWSNFSITAIANIKRIDRIDENTLNARNQAQLFTQTPFSKVNLDDFATTNEANWTFLLGVVFKFGK